jgi:hypothetical protein
MSMKSARVAAAIVVGGATVLQLTGCSKTIEPGATASYVADYVANNSPAKVRPTDVSCPSGVEAKVGTEFDCHFTGPDGKYTAHLKIRSVDGTQVKYDVNTYRS